MGYWDDMGESPGMLGRYEDAGSPEWILRIIKLGSQKGKEMEKFMIWSFNCVEDAPDSESDVRAFDFLLQVKTAGIWADGKPKWQHIEPEHDWNALLLITVDYHSLELHIMCREGFEEMRNDLGDKIKQGGSNSYQGYWFTDAQANPYMNHFLSISYDHPDEGEMDCDVLENALNNCLG